MANVAGVRFYNDEEQAVGKIRRGLQITKMEALTLFGHKLHPHNMRFIAELLIVGLVEVMGGSNVKVQKKLIIS